MASLILEVAGAILALRLIRSTRHYPAWLAVAVAFAMMAIRRIVVLFNIWMDGGHTPVNIVSESVSLAVSLLLVVAMVKVRPVIEILYKALHEQENTNKWLKKEIAKRKTAEMKASSNEEKFRKLADHSPILIWMSDRGGLCTYFNERWLHFRGRTHEQERGMGWTEGLHPQDRQGVIQKYFHAFTNQESFELEYRLMHASGDYRWIFDQGSPMYDKNRDFLGYIGSCIDITERKATEQQLKESEHRFRAFFNDNNAVMMIIDPESGRITSANKRAREYYGYKNLESMTIQQINVLPEKVVKQKMQDIFARRKKFFRFRHRLANAQVRYVEAYPTPIELEGAKYLYSIIHDITERVIAEEALQLSERKFRKIVNTLPQFVAYVDTNYIYRLVNNTYLDYFGLKEKEIVGKHIKEVIGQSSFEKSRPHLERVLAGEQVHYQEHFEYPNGKQADMEATMIPEFGRQGEVIGYYAILSDITHYIQNQQLLEESRNRMRVLSEYQQNLLEKERSYIAREIHDELGQNLTAIRMGLAMVKKNFPGDQRQLLLKLEEINQITDSTLSAVKKLSTELRPQLIDDMGLIAAIEWYVNQFEKRSGIDCRIDLTEEEITFPKDVAIHIYRILQEALTNVYKHAQAGEVDISLIHSSSTIRLTIQDDGRGMKKQDQEKGHSYGIMGMEERVRMMGGKFDISGSSEGTTIDIEIPFDG